MADLQEGFWDNLLDYIQDRTVVPVIGSELVTVREGDSDLPLYRWAAQRLAADLELPTAELPSGFDLNDVVSLHQRQHGEREELYAQVHRMLRKHLLILGCNYGDWLARFFLRTARNRELSQRKRLGVLVGDQIAHDASLALFLKSFNSEARVVPSTATEFVLELARSRSSASTTERGVTPPGEDEARRGRQDSDTMRAFNIPTFSLP